MSRDRALAIKALIRDVADRQLAAFGLVPDPSNEWTRLLDHVIGNSAMVIDMAIDGGDIKGDDKTTDGYHTFQELYDHRITLYIALCRLVVTRVPHVETHVWRSRLHSDGSSIPGWFVLGIGTEPGRQITYHLPLERWDETRFAIELERGPAFDGHTAVDVLARLRELE